MQSTHNQTCGIKRNTENTDQYLPATSTLTPQLREGSIRPNTRHARNFPGTLKITTKDIKRTKTTSGCNCGYSLPQLRRQPLQLAPSPRLRHGQLHPRKLKQLQHEVPRTYSWMPPKKAAEKEKNQSARKQAAESTGNVCKKRTTQSQ